MRRQTENGKTENRKRKKQQERNKKQKIMGKRNGT